MSSFINDLLFVDLSPLRLLDAESAVFRTKLFCTNGFVLAHSTYLGCLLDEALSGESMALKIINKINSKLRFLYRKNRFLSPPLRRLLCNSLIQPHFDYACSAWYPNLNKRLKSKLQILQNKCIRFCLNLNNRAHIGQKEFEKINWLPVNDRFKQVISSMSFKFCNNTTPPYMNDVFKPTG